LDPTSRQNVFCQPEHRLVFDLLLFLLSGGPMVI
jgi:hypothetical protein